MSSTLRDRDPDEIRAATRIARAQWQETTPATGEPAYTLADIATYPWLRPYKWQGQDIEAWPNLKRWYAAVRARPAVQRGLAVLAEKVDRSGARPEGERWNNLFGSGQHGPRRA